LLENIQQVSKAGSKGREPEVAVVKIGVSLSKPHLVLLQDEMCVHMYCMLCRKSLPDLILCVVLVLCINSKWFSNDCNELPWTVYFLDGN